MPHEQMPYLDPMVKWDVLQRPSPADLDAIIHRVEHDYPLSDDAALLVAEVRALQQELRAIAEASPEAREQALRRHYGTIADTPGFPFGPGC